LHLRPLLKERKVSNLALTKPNAPYLYIFQEGDGQISSIEVFVNSVANVSSKEIWKLYRPGALKGRLSYSYFFVIFSAICLIVIEESNLYSPI
jgi:hypothetical protein